MSADNERHDELVKIGLSINRRANAVGTECVVRCRYIVDRLRDLVSPAVRPQFLLIALLLTSCTDADRSKPQVDWLNNLVLARQKAATDGKDLLINFTGLAWCGPCNKLEREVLSTEEFAPAENHFVLVRLDYQAGAERLPQEPPPPHAAWKREYGIKSFPTVLLADASGKPYAALGTSRFKPREYIARLNELRDVHARRDAAFAAASQSRGIGRAQALAQGLAELAAGFAEAKQLANADPLVHFYRAEIDAVIALDVDNCTGLRARFQKLLLQDELATELTAFYRLVDETYQQKGIDDTLGLLDAAIENVDFAESRNRLRRSRLQFLERAKRYEKALAYAETLIADESYSLKERRSIRGTIAMNHFRLGRVDEAVEIYDQLIAEVKDNPRETFSYLWDKAEYILWHAERYVEALATWDLAIKLVEPETTDWLDAQAWRIRLLARLGRVDDARAAYDQLSRSTIATRFDCASMLAQMAVMLERSGTPQAALDAAESAQLLLDQQVNGENTSASNVQGMIDRVVAGSAPEQIGNSTLIGRE